MIKIKMTNSNFEREPLAAPFGFKGNYVKELWQTVVSLEDENEQRGIGLGVQSILWSDSQVFSTYGEMGGNSLMFLMTQFALKKAQGISFESPIELLDQLLPLTHEYGKTITGNPQLRKTFALNALTPLDHAAWQLYSRQNGIYDFDKMIPEDVRPALNHRHQKLAAIPLITYDVSTDMIAKMLEQGYFFLKIKIGSDPEKDGDMEKMLEWDKKRLSAIHSVVKDFTIPYTNNHKIPYYLDANGRYDSKDRLLKFLDHADKIGAIDQIIILEEPFSEEYDIDVSDIPVCLAADESAHSEVEALECIQRGYGAIALKPIAKTMSVSLKIAKLAYEKGIPCFCADLTVNPVMVDWNKNIGARLAPLPGMNIGVLESNGSQNYTNWEAMHSYHPFSTEKWTKMSNGLFELDQSFYECSGGSFHTSDHYLGLVK